MIYTSGAHSGYDCDSDKKSHNRTRPRKTRDTLREAHNHNNEEGEGGEIKQKEKRDISKGWRAGWEGCSRGRGRAECGRVQYENLKRKGVQREREKRAHHTSHIESRKHHTRHHAKESARNRVRLRSSRLCPLLCCL